MTPAQFKREQAAVESWRRAAAYLFAAGCGLVVVALLLSEAAY